jgi:hypothetical protein
VQATARCAAGPGCGRLGGESQRVHRWSASLSAGQSGQMTRTGPDSAVRRCLEWAVAGFDVAGCRRVPCGAIRSGRGVCRATRPRRRR